MKKYNGVSIVIPTHAGHISFLSHLLESLTTAGKLLKKEGYEYEVILVASSHNEKIEQICKDFHATYITGEKSLTISRNLGIKASRYDIVLFVDSDCEVSKSLLIQHMLVYERSNDDKLGGVLGLTVFKGRKTFGFKIIEKTSFVLPFRFAEITEHPPWGTCTNISFKKEVLEKIKGFDEKWPLNHGGEDVDIGWRVNDSGFYIVSNPKAIVYHTTETWASFFKNIQKVWTWGKADYYLFKKFPSKKCFDIIKYPVLWFIILVLEIASWYIFKNILFLFMFFVFVLLSLLVHGLLMKKMRDTPVLIASLGEFLFSTFELGFVLEGIKNIDTRPLYQKILHSPNQFIYSWNVSVVRTWTTFFIMLFLFITEIIIINLLVM